jgi:hypothetical protein
MHKPSWNFLLAAAIGVVLFASTCVLRAAEKAAENGGVRIANDNLGVAISIGNRPVLHYRDAEVRKKPYVDRLFSPAGVQVLRDAPADHLHHHGLMYAVKVDGVNYWEEIGPKFGSQKGGTPRLMRRVLRTGLVQDLEWLPPGARKPAMVERRAVDLLLASELGATLVEWQCRLETPKGKPSLSFGGNHYHGLGLRFVSSMDHGGHFIYADGATPVPYQPEDSDKPATGTWLTPARWCAYSAQADGRPVTVAMFDDPHNFRHPATMFTLAAPFAYISATLNERKQPFTIRAGQPLELCYAVAVWDGEQDRPTIEKLYQRWLNFRANEPENFYDDVRELQKLYELEKGLRGPTKN